MKTNTNKRSKIPQFINREEEATFWESHSVSDFIEEFKPINARFAKNLSEGLHIRLNSQTLHTLREKAKNKGIGPTTLVRMWILEQLQSPQQHV
jgi:predicted DNA binding CopG/RHH family protein